MFQIVNEVGETAVRLCSEYGPYIAVGVLAMVAVGVGLHFIKWAVSSGRHRPPS
jgi:hypothetical protein